MLFMKSFLFSHGSFAYQSFFKQIFLPMDTTLTGITSLVLIGPVGNNDKVDIPHTLDIQD